jgi:hypothetical protein
MRNVQNQNKRMRGRNNNNNNNNNNRKSHNPLTRVFESNGPDVKIRGTASHVAEKYIQLARDAQASGDPVGAENYYQHAEHYFRLIATAQEQLRQNQPQQYQQHRQENVTGNDSRDGTFDDDGDDEGVSQETAGEQPQFGPRDPQPFIPRDANFYGQSGDQPQRSQGDQPRQPPQPAAGDTIDRLPSFITGGSQPQPQDNAQGGFENGDGGQQRFQGDRQERQGFRRRRRHRGGYRNEGQTGATAAGQDDGGDAPG